MNNLRKKIVSLCLTLCLCTVSILNVSSCGKQSANSLTMGVWLELIAQAFGMSTYQESTPYFEQVNSDSPYFDVFQAAAEWEIIDSKEDLSADAPLTWEQALVTLVNAGEFLDAANEAWIAKEYVENIENVEFTEDVVDFLDEPVDYTVDGNTVTITEASLPSELEAGDYYTLPATTTRPASINKVASIEYVDGRAIITNAEDLTEDAYADIRGKSKRIRHIQRRGME